MLRKKEVKKMRLLKIGLISILSIGLSVSFVFAAGDAAKGKDLFNDTQLGGGTAGISCNSCHPDGKGLEKAADKKNLPKVVNACIKNALKGKGLDPKSAEMADLIAYIKSVKRK
jgi:mono/diheme cytochrome c family protein